MGRGDGFHWLAVHPATMDYLYHHHNQAVILNLADNPVVAHPVTPLPTKTTVQGVSNVPGIIRRGHALVHKGVNAPRRLRIQPVKLTLRRRGIINGPCQV